MRALLVLSWISGVAGAARADTDNEGHIGSFVRALRSNSANAITEDSLAGPAFGYARKLPLELLPKLELWGTGEMLFGFASGEMFQTLATDLEMLQMAVGARARYPLWREYISGTARLDFGTQRAALSLEDMQGHSASDTGWGATTTGALGIDLLPLSRKSIAVGLRFELGYVAATGIDLTAKSAGVPDGTIELDRMAASLGHLDVSGRYFSMLVTVLL
jgi:hypothetical protein